MTITLRRASHGDESALVELNSLVQSMHAANHPSVFKSPNGVELSAFMRDAVDDPNAQIWLAEESGEPVGYVLARLQERPENPFCHPRRFFEIDQISVRPKKQHCGVGRQLIEQVIQMAAAEGVPAVELGCWSFNHDAQAAFERLGFSPRWTRFWRSVP